jgi:ribosome-associated protein
MTDAEQSASRPSREQRESMLGVNRQLSKDGESRNASPEASEQARRFAIEAARTLLDDKCEDILVLDLRGHSQVTDYFVVASGTSERQMRSAATDVSKLGDSSGFAVLKHNLEESGATWFLIDFVDVIVHVFEPETRLFYDLEMLWGDAEPVDWTRPEDEVSHMAGPWRNRAGLRPDELPDADDA